MNYTPSNLPRHIRESILYQCSAEPEYIRAKKKSAEAVENASRKLRPCVALQLLEEEYIAKQLKHLGTKEAVDKWYNDHNRPLMSFIPDDRKQELLEVMQCAMLTTDILEEFIRQFNEIVGECIGAEYQETLVGPILQGTKMINNRMCAFNRSQTDLFVDMFGEEGDRLIKYITERSKVLKRKYDRAYIKQIKEQNEGNV